jgi:hypothetical protein
MATEKLFNDSNVLLALTTSVVMKCLSTILQTRSRSLTAFLTSKLVPTYYLTLTEGGKVIAHQ